MVEGHIFLTKSNEGYWLVKCLETGGSFSTKMWAMEKEKQQYCPCCKKKIRRNRENGVFLPMKSYVINDVELSKIIKFCKESKDKDLDNYIKKIKVENKL